MTATRLETFGWRVWRGAVLQMPTPHQHSELEINFVFSGAMTYLFGGELRRVAVGSWLVFWGALPHALIETEPQTECLWLTVPLTDFLRFALPETLTHFILHGAQLEGSGANDEAMFTAWLADYGSGNLERQRILELELEARLRRLALTLGTRSQAQSIRQSSSAALQLAQIITERYLEPLTLPEIAAAAELNVNYASSLFKQSFGMTLLAYLTQHRVAHAQRLLVTTSTPILELAFESGFQSASAFYDAFKRATGITPLEYRFKGAESGGRRAERQKQNSNTESSNSVRL